MLIRLLVLLLISTCLLALATQRKPAPFAPDLHTETLWGAPAPTYLSGVRDDYCHAGAHSHWSDAISSDRLAEALRSDSRTDVGQTIRELIVSRRDKTGRAELVSITGSQKRVISGWEFKLIVGRALGWNVLKSSRFTISRSGSTFVFHGSGFGHGLGLCQESFAKGPVLSPIELERKLTTAKSAAEMKAAYAAAYATVRDLIRVEGENKLWQRVARRSYDVTATAR
jgi:hypothetical protein